MGKVKQAKGEVAQLEAQKVRAKLSEQKRIKENFKAKYEVEIEKLALFAAFQHHLDDKLVQELAHIEDLDHENVELREELPKLKRRKVVSIK